MTKVSHALDRKYITRKATPCSVMWFLAKDVRNAHQPQTGAAVAANDGVGLRQAWRKEGRRDRLKKMCKLMSGVLLAGMLLVGCAEKPPEELLIADIQTATIYLREDGSVQSSYVEEFDKAYYDVIY